MSILSKVKDYARVCKALEEMQKQNSGLRVQLQLYRDDAERQRKENDNLRVAVAKLREMSAAPSGDVVVISAPKPEKRRSYALALQKQLMDYIGEKDGEIFVKVVKPE